jgi:hypothetical protein
VTSKDSHHSSREFTLPWWPTLAIGRVNHDQWTLGESKLSQWPISVIKRVYTPLMTDISHWESVHSLMTNIVHWESVHSLDDRYRLLRECSLPWWPILVIERVFTPSMTNIGHWESVDSPNDRIAPQESFCAADISRWEGHVPILMTGTILNAVIIFPMVLTGHWEGVEWGLVMLSRTLQYLYPEPSCLQC